jgi:hypothetical protein
MPDPDRPPPTAAPPPNARPLPRPPGPDPLDPAVVTVLDGVPEFVPVVRALIEECDDDPGGAVVLTELAEFVAGQVAGGGDPAVVERALAAVETVARSGPDGARLAAAAFLDRLADPDRSQLAPWMGPRTRALLDDDGLDDDGLDDDGLDDDGLDDDRALETRPGS